ncbi:MAG TPA: acylphosphatase [Acidocella sp.]|nr:MAG: acylphosphatase [Rhodospirillales bacterium 20-64-7]HQT46983.1 acylphosphatase [Acidocella sp.]
MKATHLIITGRVQGVGFRDWLAGEAHRLGLAGWVRNIGHDQVEALIAGETSAVEECLRTCRRGPPLASVKSITDANAQPPAEAGFHKLASRPHA